MLSSLKITACRLLEWESIVSRSSVRSFKSLCVYVRQLADAFGCLMLCVLTFDDAVVSHCCALAAMFCKPRKAAEMSEAGTHPFIDMSDSPSPD